MTEVPPPSLAPDSFASTLYDALAPLAADDGSNDWALLVFCNAIGQMFQPVEELVRDTPDGPGWSQLVDLSRCPDEALPWLAQFVGVRVSGTPAQQRAQIAAKGGFGRGTPEAIRAAIQATLTGDKTVVFRERDSTWGSDPPYQLGVVTYDSETPNEAVTLTAALSQKPAGILLQYASNPGQDWAQLKSSYATWTAVKAAYPDWTAVIVDEP